MNKKEDLQNMANIMEELEGNAQQMVAAMASAAISPDMKGKTYISTIFSLVLGRERFPKKWVFGYICGMIGTRQNTGYTAGTVTSWIYG